LKKFKAFWFKAFWFKEFCKLCEELILMSSKVCSAEAGSGIFQFRQLLQFVLRQQPWWLGMLIWLIAAPAQAALELRVAVARDASQVQVGSSTDAVLKDVASGKEISQIPAMNAIVAQPKGGAVAFSQFQAGAIWVEPSNGGYVFVGDKWYRGRVLVVPTDGGLTAVNYVDLDQYLYSVVGGEMGARFPMEALRAQAIAARTYALYQRQTSANDVFDVGDTTAWQYYDGLDKETAETRAAVDSTQSLVLTYNNQIINAVFSACSGGHTQNSEDVWTNALPYLRGVEDYDLTVPQALASCQWTAPISAQKLKDAVSGIGTITGFTAEPTANGKIARVKFVGESGERTLTGNQVREALGLRGIPSRIEVTQTQQVASAGSRVPVVPAQFQFTGGGYGHGIGLSQWGAYGMAQAGNNFEQILLHYYTGVQLAKLEVQ
jgi:stage II sporulation protein D